MVKITLMGSKTIKWTGVRGSWQAKRVHEIPWTASHSLGNPTHAKCNSATSNRCKATISLQWNAAAALRLRRQRKGGEELTSHWKGFSPVWVLMCSSRPRFWLKALLHSEHWYGFSCVQWQQRVKVRQHRAQLIKALEFHAGWCKFYILSKVLQSVKTTENDFQMIKWKLGKLWPDSFHFSTHLWINYLFQSFKPSHLGSLFFVTWKVQKHKIPMFFILHKCLKHTGK